MRTYPTRRFMATVMSTSTRHKPGIRTPFERRYGSSTPLIVGACANGGKYGWLARLHTSVTDILFCTTEALEIKGAANSVCLRRIVVQSIYSVRFRSVWVRLRVRFRSVWVSLCILWYKPVTLHPLCGLVDTLLVAAPL